jgi:hypothetical protein
MKNLVFAAALVALTAAPAFAAPIDEIAQDVNTPVQVVQAPAPELGAGRIVNGEVDGLTAPARIDELKFVSRPGSVNVNPGGGR